MGFHDLPVRFITCASEFYDRYCNYSKPIPGGCIFLITVYERWEE